MPDRWSVYYYEKPDGNSPVKDYIDALSIWLKHTAPIFLPGTQNLILRRKRMKSYRDHLAGEIVNPEFKKIYEEEKYLLELGLRIAETRQELGISQKELAEKSRITQQQLSKIENGYNCNLLTFIKVSSTLGLSVNLSA
jgi:DNA-binding XRE family transcriptional regulator